MPDTAEAPRRIAKFGVFEVDLGVGELRRQGRLVALQEHPFLVLVALLERPGEEVSREELRRRLWPDRSFLDFENGINTAVAKLRSALGDSGENPRFIATRPRHGYRFIAPVERTTPSAGALASAGDVSSTRETGSVGRTLSSAAPRRSWAWMLAFGLLFAAALYLANRGPSVTDRRGASDEPFSGAQESTIHSPPGELLTGSFALSPDGEKLACVTSGSTPQESRLWLRELDGVDMHPLPGTEGAAMPFWSPDGREIGFFTQRALKKVDLERGTVTTITGDSPVRGRGGSWGRDGTILYAEVETPVLSIDAAGGRPTAVTDLAGAPSHRFPSFLPDGRHFLYLLLREDRLRSEVWWGQLGSREGASLVVADSNAFYVPPGFLVYGRGGALLAQRFDPVALRLTGPPFVVENGVDIYGENGPTGLGAFSASAAGALAFASLPSQALRLAWFDRSGHELSRIGPAGDYAFLDLSPDGARAAVVRFDSRKRESDLQIVDLETGALTQLTDDPWPDGAVAWAPVGPGRVAYSSLRDGHWRTLVREPSSSAIESEVSCPSSAVRWFADGRSLVCERASPETGVDLWRVPLGPEEPPLPVMVAAGNQTQGELSRDGRWLAYISDRDGKSELYVRDLERPSKSDVRIFRGGASSPRWRQDSRELVFMSDTQLVAVDLRHGSQTEFDPPRVLFNAPLPRADSLTDFGRSFGISPEGDRFLIAAVTEDQPRPTIRILAPRRSSASH